MQILSRTSLKNKSAERARKRDIRKTRDSISKLRARPDPVVVNGFPDDPILHQIVRDENGTFWKRNQTNTDWEQFLDEGSEDFVIQTYLELPSLPTGNPRVIWFEGQLWGAASNDSRWSPTMRYTATTGVPLP